MLAPDRGCTAIGLSQGERCAIAQILPRPRCSSKRSPIFDAVNPRHDGPLFRDLYAIVSFFDFKVLTSHTISHRGEQTLVAKLIRARL